MTARYIIAAGTDAGEIREKNQDNLFINGKFKEDPGRNIWHLEEEVSSETPLLPAVFDGMGGMQKGEAAALAACQETASLYSRLQEGEDWDPEAFLLRTNRKVAAISMGSSKTGCTAVLLEKRGDCFRSWNVGDSRAYYFHEGALSQLSTDHNEARNMGLVRSMMSLDGKPEDPGQAEKTARRNASSILTQFLGVNEEDFLIEPAASGWKEAAPGDIFLLCSDGLTGMVSDEEITEILARKISTEEKRNLLMRAAITGGGEDNITAILIERA